MRRVLASLVALTTLSATAPAARAAEDPRSRRAALLVRSAELTDRLEVAQTEVVAAQALRGRARSGLSRLRDRMRARAVRAYLGGPTAALPVTRAPRPYLEVAASRERQLVSGYRTASTEAADHQERAEQARSELRSASARLAEVQARLEAAIAADDVRRLGERRLAEDQQRADEARLAAMAVDEGGGLGSSRHGGPGGAVPSPLDPGALRPRHRTATLRQLELMRRVRFGPLAPGAPLPPGLRITGPRVAGNASWYGPGFNGRPTASGAIYDQEGWTVASKELPLGTVLLVSRGHRRVLLLVNDRGPYIGGRVLDLSAAAARALGVGGVAPVVADVVGR